MKDSTVIYFSEIQSQTLAREIGGWEEYKLSVKNSMREAARNKHTLLSLPSWRRRIQTSSKHFLLPPFSLAYQKKSKSLF